jgi:NitT/TauT family transport system substrate-binding protein
MTMLRRRFLASAAAGAAVAAACPGAARAQTTSTLRVGTVLVQLYGAPYFAGDAGAFAQAGFDTAVTTVTTVKNGPEVAAALAGGSVDLGVIDLISAASAITKGIPLQLIAGSGLYRSNQPWQVIAVAKDSPFRSARDLEGKTIAMVSIAGLALASTRGWLRQNGVDPAKVNFVEFQQPAMAAGLTRKTFDAAFIGEPFITFDKNGANEMRVIGHPLDCIGDGYLVSCWFSTRAWLEQNRDRKDRVVAAIYDTARWANAHQAQTLAILAQNASINPDLLRGMVRVDYATATTPATLQPMLSIGYTEKLIPAIDAASLLRA